MDTTKTPNADAIIRTRLTAMRNAVTGHFEAYNRAVKARNGVIADAAEAGFTVDQIARELKTQPSYVEAILASMARTKP